MLCPETHDAIWRTVERVNVFLLRVEEGRLNTRPKKDVAVFLLKVQLAQLTNS